MRAFVSQKKIKFPVLNLKWDLCKPLHINWFFSHASKNQKTYIYKIVKCIVIRLYSSDSCKIVKIPIKDGWRFLKKEKKKKKKFLFVTLLVIWYACYFHGQRREAGGDVVMGF